MERIPAASAMDWSIELDRGLRSRHHATRIHALDAAGPRLRQLCSSPTVPAPVASAFGVLPGEARLFAETMLLRLATEFRTADGALRARIVGTLLAARGRGSLAGARVAEPDQLLRRVKVVYDTGSARDKALALRVFGCLADIAKDSVHVRSLILSSLGATSALEVKAALFAACCICRQSEDFSRIILEVLRRLSCSRRSEPQVILAAIKAFPKLDCTLAVIHRVHEVGKKMVLGTLEDVFKAEMLSSLSRLASKSTILFSDQVELLLLFLGHDSSPSMKSMALKCLCFMFRRNTCHFPVIQTVFGRLIPLIDDEDFPLHCRSNVLRILQKMFCGKAPSINHGNGSELSKLVLAAENSLRSSSWEMQGTALEILVEILCFLKQARPDLTITTLNGSSFAYAECQGTTNNMPLTYEENGKDRPLSKIITAIVNHSVSLVNQVISKRSEKVTSRNICISAELNKRKLADAFEAGSFSFWFKSLLLFSAGEIEMKLLLFPSATVKLVGELKAEGDLSEDFNCTEIDADDTPSGSQELHGFRAKITGICGRTCLANDALASNASSDCEFFFQRWFIRLRLSFLEVLTDVLGIVSAQSSAYKAREDNLTVSGELMRDQILALAHCSLRLSDLAKSYDLLAAFHIDMDHHSFSSIARLAFMCSLLAFCTAYSVDFSKTYIDVEPCKLPKRFSHASILQDLHGRVDGSDRQIVSKLRQFMPTSFDELDCLQSSARMSCSCNLEKDSYSLFHFAVTSLLGVRGNAKSKGTGDGEDCLSALHGGLQFLSCILQKFMELPFMIPKYFFRVRPCLGAELYMFDSNPAHRHGILVAPGSNLSLTLCMQWKRVLERSAIRLVKLYCILAVSSEPSIDVAGTRSKQFEPHKIAEMVELNTKLLHYIKNDLRKSRGEKNLHLGTDMVTAFACFEPTDSGQGFSSCLLNVSSFPEGSYQIKWHACCVDENGSYFGLPPLNDGAVFSVRMS